MLNRKIAIMLLKQEKPQLIPRVALDKLDLVHKAEVIRKEERAILIHKVEQKAIYRIKE